jgi:hypothetical protein
VEAGATVRADAGERGSGGDIIVWADGTTRYEGAISARGGSEGGDGGFAEVSGKQVLDFQGTVDLTADQGKTGTLLLDPLNVTISTDTDNNEIESGGTFEPTGSPSVINVNTLATALGSSNVVVTTDSTKSEEGDITVEDTVQWFGTNTLTLQAADDILINANIRAVEGNITLTFVPWRETLP